jgi:hypothetical protein
LPKGLAATVKRAAADPRLLELGDDIALLQGRIATLLQEMQRASPPPWGASVESLNDLCRAVRDGEGVEAALARHAQVVRSGADAAANLERCWERIQKTIDLKARASHLDWKRQCDLRTVLPAEQVMALVNAVLAAVEDLTRDHTGGPDLYRKICARALYYMPPECRQAGNGNGTVIDNDPGDSP